MTLKPLRTAQPAVRGGPPIDPELYRWLASINTAIENSVPPGTIKWANLTADDITQWFDGTGRGLSPGRWERWAICNGNNGTPDANGRFFRANTAAAGATGGSDSSAHTHAIDHDHASFTSGAESGHTHAIDHDHASFTSGAGSAHSHGSANTANGSLHARVNIVDGTTDLYLDRDTSSWTADTVATVSSSTTSAAVQAAGSIVAGATAAESAHTHTVDVPALTGTSGASSGHTHSVDVPAIAATSGAASATDNRPAYVDAVPLMRLEAV